MKKSILLVMFFLLILFSSFIFYKQIYKHKVSNKDNVEFAGPIISDEISHVLPSGEIDYQFYYNHDRSFGCNYYLNDNLVYYMSQSIEAAPLIIEMPKADIETLKVFDNLYAKDKNFAYFMGKVLENADSSTFEGVYSGDANGCPAEIGASSSATRLARDKNNIYHDGRIVSILDASSFEMLGNGYMKTKDGIFKNEFEIEPVLKADIETFKIIEFSDYLNYVEAKYDAQDKNNKYKYGKVIGLFEL